MGRLVEEKERIVSPKSKEQGSEGSPQQGSQARRNSLRVSGVAGASPVFTGDLGKIGPRAESLQERGKNTSDNSSTDKKTHLGGVRMPGNGMGAFQPGVPGHVGTWTVLF